MTRSSIFSSEILDRLRESPRSRQRWVGFLLCSAALLALGHGALLGRVFRDPDCRTPDPRVLCIGTSHQMNAIDADRLGVGVHKLDAPGLDLALGERAFREHRDRWDGVELALIEVDEFSLFSDTVGARLDDLSGLCGTLDLAAWKLVDPEDDAWRRYRILANVWYGRGSPSLAADRRFTTGRLFPSTVAPVPDSHPPGAAASSPSALDEGAAAHRVAYARRQLFLNAEERNLRTRNLPALLRLVEALDTRGCRVVLVSYPLSEVYRRARPPEWDRLLEEATREVVRRFPAVEVRNYRAHPRFSDVHFANVDHLNERGAALLTELLAD